MGKRDRNGAEAFSGYYRNLFGDRWDTLRDALHHEAPRVAWGDPPYYLDPASVAAARLLPLGQRNLDLCAAPGGKALILARRMAPEAQLTTNERSRARRARLLRVLEEHLPHATRERITVTGHDAARWGIYEPDSYDAVLVDVPCSSERHVLAAPAELERWSPSRVSRLAVQQFAILAAAIDSTRPGGAVLYSTCALTPEENDGIVARALKRRADRIALDVIQPRELDCGEPTEYGIHILPDRCDGAGPMYIARLRRR